MSTPEEETQPESGNAIEYKKKPSKRKLTQGNDALYKANLECFGPEMAKLLEDHPEANVAVEPNVTITSTALKNPTCLVIIGFAGLQTIEAARRVKKDVQNFIIIEPSLSVFKQTIRRFYVGNLVQDDNVDLVVGVDPDQLGPHLLKVFTSVDAKGARAAKCLSPEIICDPFVYMSEDGKEMHPIAKQIVDTVAATAKQVVLSMGCASDSFFRWEQLIRNEKNLQKSYRIETLFDQFKDLPAVVLGAGPSLKEFIDAYHEYKLQDRVLILACDASLRRLLDHGIRPHLVTRCERKYTPIFRGVEPKDTADLFYAAYPWCDPAYFDLFNRSFMMFRGNGVSKSAAPYAPGNVDGGVSSANAALELAYLFGCKKIFLSGIDLCFLDGKSHAEGTQVEFDPESSRAKWTEITANNGEKVTTIPVWKRCLAEYQGAIFKHHPLGAEVFNTSHRGAVIPGAKYIPWQEASDRILSCPKGERILSRIESRLDLHAPGYSEGFQKNKKEFIKMLDEFLGEAEKLFLSVHDHMLIGKREEERIMGQLQSFSDPDEYFSNVASITKGLISVYRKPQEEVDRFKQKFYRDKLFSQSIIDICMVDFAQTENKIMSLVNTVERDYSRMRMYVGLHMGLFKTFEYYARMLRDLLKNGADQSVEYYNGHPVEDLMQAEARMV